MKILTWNINGIRATKEALINLLESTQADIICLQETKITRDQLESDIALLEGYNSYFSFSQTRSGYSGVATYCKNSITPFNAQTGLGDIYESDAGKDSVGCYGNLSTLFSEERLKELDVEGRTVITQHKLKDSSNHEMHRLSIINVYCPRADPEKPERRSFKLDFYKALEERAKALLCNGSHVIILGDVNTSHRPIDHCDPSDPIIFYDNQARVWLDSFVFNDGDYSALPNKFSADLIKEKGVFVDTFRYKYPQKPEMYTCWCTSNRARQTNYGTRIDYIFCDAVFARNLKSCEILTDVLGSDHCPVEGVFNIAVECSKNCPALCTCFITEFGGKQQKLLSYFSKVSNKSLSQPKKDLNIKRPLPPSYDDIDRPKVSKQKKKSSQLKLTSFINVEVESKKNIQSPKIQTKNASDSLSKPSKKTNDASLFWKKVLKGPDPPPLCPGHKEPAVLRTVKKDGFNFGRQFYCCCRPEGNKSNPEASCQFFQWRKKK